MDVIQWMITESNSSLHYKIISSDANEALETGKVVDYLDIMPVSLTRSF